MRTTDHFNIALIPVSTTFQKFFLSMAESYFQTLADGYLLGTRALAHVTMCQFHAGSNDEAVRAFHLWDEKQDMDLILDKFHLRPGLDDHMGKWWAQFQVRESSKLRSLQSSLVRHLRMMGLNTRTLVEEYDPHLTLARISGHPTDLPKGNLAPILFRTVVAVSSHYGVLKQILV